MYSEVIVKRVVRLKRGSSRSIRSPVAVRIERSALGLDRNVPHAFVRALRRELVNRHTQNFRGMATAQMALRSRGTVQHAYALKYSVTTVFTSSLLAVIRCINNKT